MESLKLNLGCQSYGKKEYGFVDIDIVDYRDILPDMVIMDARKLEYADNTVDMIYAGHLLEHFSWPEGRRVMAEWRRVLKEGGELVVTVPDADVFARRYIAGEYDLDTFMNGMFGYRDNEPSEPDMHRSLYTPSKLVEVFEVTGFKNVTLLDQKEIAYDYNYAYIHAKPDWQITVKGYK